LKYPVFNDHFAAKVKFRSSLNIVAIYLFGYVCVGTHHKLARVALFSVDIDRAIGTRGDYTVSLLATRSFGGNKIVETFCILKKSTNCDSFSTAIFVESLRRLQATNCALVVTE
jgi:hypothetical protein